MTTAMCVMIVQIVLCVPWATLGRTECVFLALSFAVVVNLQMELSAVSNA